MKTLSAIALVEVLVPDLGDIKDVPVIEVLAKVGEPVSVDQTLVVIETEKATMDVPSTSAGVVRDVKVKVGDKISCGTLLVMVEPLDAEVRPPEKVVVPLPSSAPATPEVPAATVSHVPLEPAPMESAASTAGNMPHASPSVRRFAREFGLDLAKVAGSGPKGRILHSDLQAFVKNAVSQPQASTVKAGVDLGFGLLPWPQVDFAKFGPIERVELSKIKKISGANLMRNAIVIPHVTNFDEVDITDLEAFRVAANKEDGGNGAKLTMLAFLIKASVTALKEHPTFNASLEGEQLVLKRYFHIGFAADTPNGLVVPVIRDADTKGLRVIAAETSGLAEQARSGKLKPTDMQGGCFTVSSLGGIGGTGFTPIINAPEVAILGAARASMKPVWDSQQFAPRLVMPLSLSWDHRVIDGAAAARFLVTLGRLLADFRRVML
jgi:pyruvate dehydrogenase E2 component (dihydrolipoamide acetyltransferase)